MPWTPASSTRHTKKATTKRKKKAWAKVANKELARRGNEGRAVRIANFVVKRMTKGPEVGSKRKREDVERPEEVQALMELAADSDPRWPLSIEDPKPATFIKPETTDAEPPVEQPTDSRKEFKTADFYIVLLPSQDPRWTPPVVPPPDGAKLMLEPYCVGGSVQTFDTEQEAAKIADQYEGALVTRGPWPKAELSYRGLDYEHEGEETDIPLAAENEKKMDWSPEKAEAHAAMDFLREQAVGDTTEALGKRGGRKFKLGYAEQPPATAREKVKVGVGGVVGGLALGLRQTGKLIQHPIQTMSDILSGRTLEKEFELEPDEEEKAALANAKRAEEEEEEEEEDEEAPLRGRSRVKIGGRPTESTATLLNYNWVYDKDLRGALTRRREKAELAKTKKGLHDEALEAIDLLRSTV